MVAILGCDHVSVICHVAITGSVSQFRLFTVIEKIKKVGCNEVTIPFYEVHVLLARWKKMKCSMFVPNEL